ncbi:hypothetical protein Tsubulata_002170 [Turnera subulata]|uniref:Uncharacterized protein n=1 Tax=Turnera subulata TaxID=218843 RepID=A0A9Q0J8L7_9ROSI|nr:hypothetical protein Tsubulata_002170 [Turnera subulata]
MEFMSTILCWISPLVEVDGMISYGVEFVGDSFMKALKLSRTQRFSLNTYAVCASCKVLYSLKFTCGNESVTNFTSSQLSYTPLQRPLNTT